MDVVNFLNVDIRERSSKMNQIEQFWQQFLKDTNRPNTLRYNEAYHFELSIPAANYLLDLVLSGKKQATCSSYEGMIISNETLPVVGELNIITDGYDCPFAIVETTKVLVMRYGDITYERCSLEGEDESLASWQDNHRKFFTEEGKKLGYTFSEEMLIVFEEFKLIYKKERL